MPTARMLDEFRRSTPLPTHSALRFSATSCWGRQLALFNAKALFGGIPATRSTNSGEERCKWKLGLDSGYDPRCANRHAGWRQWDDGQLPRGVEALDRCIT